MSDDEFICGTPSVEASWDDGYPTAPSEGGDSCAFPDDGSGGTETASSWEVLDLGIDEDGTGGGTVVEAFALESLTVLSAADPVATLTSEDGTSTVPPITGTTSGWGTPTSWDAAGNPTHVTYSGVVNPPVTNEVFGGQSTAAGQEITDPNYWRLQEMMTQSAADNNTMWLTGVTTDRTGDETTYWGGGKPFDDFGDAVENERDPL